MFQGLVKTRITTMNLLSALLMTLFLAASIGYFLLFKPLQEREKSLAEARRMHVEQQQALIRDNVLTAIDMVDFIVATTRRDVQRTLEDRLLRMCSLAELLRRQGYGPQQRLQVVVSQLQRMEWPQPELWFGLFAADGQLLFEPTATPPVVDEAKILAGLSDLPPAQVRFWSPETAADLLAAVHIDDLSATLVLRVPAADLQRQIQRQVFSYLSRQRFGDNDYGYYFVIGPHNRPLMVATFQPPYRADGGSLQVPEGYAELLEDFRQLVRRQGAGYHRYRYDNPARGGELEEKIAFVAPYAELDWIIGSGFYLSDLETGFRAIEQQVLRQKRDTLVTGVVLLSLNLLFSLAVALWLNRHIRHLEQQQQARLHELEQYKKLLDLSCLVSKGDLEGRITYANEAFQQVSGYRLEEMLGQPHSLFRHPAMPRAVFKNLWETIQAGRVWRGSSKNRAKDGHDFYTQQVIMPITDRDGHILEYIAARYDITELLQKREQLNLAFSTDTLTALGSRFKLMKDINALTGPACLALIDINNFHGINKLYGTEGGDRALVYLSKILSKTFAGEQLSLYRLNADIFAVLAGHERPLERELRRFLADFPAEPFYVDAAGHQTVPLALTVGLACTDENLLTCADIAWKQAKRNNLVLALYDPASADRDEYHEKMFWIDAVRQALSEGRILAYFQPIVSLADGSVAKYETLMRLQREDGSIVAPGAFLPVLQQTPYYVYLTHAIIEQACSTFKDRPCPFAINFSVDDLLRKETVQLLIDTAQRYGVMERLVLEVVETENIQNYDQALATLAELKARGCRISIDDFGTGYSNFSYLTQLRADIIKIDGSLIQSLDKDAGTRELVSSIVRFAHNAGMQVVAEFVDRPELASIVRQLGCDFAQGYLYSPPVPATQMPDGPGCCARG